MLPKSYRARLVGYITLIAAFLAVTLVYSYNYARDTMLSESRQHLVGTALVDANQLERRNAELQRFVNLISADSRLQEYLGFAILNGDSGPLQRLLDKLFVQLSAKRGLVFSSDGRVLLGGDHVHLVSEILHRDPWKTEKSEAFYYQGPEELEFVSFAPIMLRGENLGLVALSYSVPNMLMGNSNITANDAYFIEHNSVIEYSSIASLIKTPFFPEDGHIKLKDEIFQVLPIASIEATNGMSTIWRATNETRLLNSLVSQGQRIVALTVLGILIVFLIGVSVIRNFSRPMAALMELTQDITQGQLPDIVKTKPHTEIDALSNNFVDMIQALKDKQSQTNKTQQALEKSAITDTLTNLYNRRHLLDLFPKLQAQARRDNRVITAILCDLDYFKQLNDKYGHLAGDKVLVEFAKTLQEQSRDNDFLYRMGGEEFLILSLGDDPSGATILAEKIRTAAREQVVVYKKQTINQTVSCGVSYSAPHEDPESSLNQLLSRADRALYQAKRRGRNQVRTYEDVSSLDSHSPTNYRSTG